MPYFVGSGVSYNEMTKDLCARAPGSLKLLNAQFTPLSVPMEACDSRITYGVVRLLQDPSLTH